jgi:hypothetical protein
MVADIQAVTAADIQVVAVHGVAVVVAVHGAAVEEVRMAARQEQVVVEVAVAVEEAVTEDNNLLSPLMPLYVILIP